VAIAAIETSYAGCRFRSRLEARWAVFFDALGIRWQYEPQGFDLDGDRYLPDFYLPDQRLWVEVKGNPAAVDAARLCKAALNLPASPTSNEPKKSGLVLLLLGDVPAEPAWHCALMVNEARYSRCVRDQAVVFVRWPCGHGTEASVVPVGYSQMLHEAEPLRPSWPAAGLPGVMVDPSTELAYRAARSARFEFGQSGAIV
jgi:hypothetical protein